MNRENRTLLILVALVLGASVLVTGAITLRGRFSRTPEVESAPTEPPFEHQDQASSLSQIAFISDEPTVGAVFVMDGDGTGWEQISESGQGICLYPAWSPDGLWLAYWIVEEYSPIKEEIVAGLWVSAVDGSEHMRINGDFSGAATFIPPAWSPDGMRIAFTSAPREEGTAVSILHVVWTNGSGFEQSIPLEWELQHLAWSPSGDELLMVSSQYRTQGGNAYVWTDETGEITEIHVGAEAADWSPSGTQIVIADAQQRAVMILGEDGEPQQVVVLGAEMPVAVDISPDGSRIAIGTTIGLGRGNLTQLYFANYLYILELETGDLYRTVDNAGRIYFGNWSPDSSHFMFYMVDYGPRPGSQLLAYSGLWDYDIETSLLVQVAETPGGFAGQGYWSPF
jgi:Tol biopolymer transport system component